MPIDENDTLEFPGSLTVIRLPITEADCTNFPTFEELVASQHLAGHGCTIRDGQAYAQKSVTDIETECEAV